MAAQLIASLFPTNSSFDGDDNHTGRNNNNEKKSQTEPSKFFLSKYIENALLYPKKSEYGDDAHGEQHAKRKGTHQNAEQFGPSTRAAICAAAASSGDGPTPNQIEYVSSFAEDGVIPISYHGDDEGMEVSVLTIPSVFGNNSNPCVGGVVGSDKESAASSPLSDRYGAHVVVEGVEQGNDVDEQEEAVVKKEEEKGEHSRQDQEVEVTYGKHMWPCDPTAEGYVARHQISPEERQELDWARSRAAMGLERMRQDEGHFDAGRGMGEAAMTPGAQQSEYTSLSLYNNRSYDVALGEDGATSESDHSSFASDDGADRYFVAPGSPELTSRYRKRILDISKNAASSGNSGRPHMPTPKSNESKLKEETVAKKGSAKTMTLSTLSTKSSTMSPSAQQGAAVVTPDPGWTTWEEKRQKELREQKQLRKFYSGSQRQLSREQQQQNCSSVPNQDQQNLENAPPQQEELLLHSGIQRLRKIQMHQSSSRGGAADTEQARPPATSATVNGASTSDGGKTIVSPSRKLFSKSQLSRSGSSTHSLTSNGIPDKPARKILSMMKPPLSSRGSFEEGNEVGIVSVTTPPRGTRSGVSSDGDNNISLTKRPLSPVSDSGGVGITSALTLIKPPISPRNSSDDRDQQPQPSLNGNGFLNGSRLPLLPPVPKPPSSSRGSFDEQLNVEVTNEGFIGRRGSLPMTKPPLSPRSSFDDSSDGGSSWSGAVNTTRLLNGLRPKTTRMGSAGRGGKGSSSKPLAQTTTSDPKSNSAIVEGASGASATPSKPVLPPAPARQSKGGRCTEGLTRLQPEISEEKKEEDPLHNLTKDLWNAEGDTGAELHRTEPGLLESEDITWCLDDIEVLHDIIPPPISPLTHGSIGSAIECKGLIMDDVTSDAMMNLEHQEPSGVGNNAALKVTSTRSGTRKRSLDSADSKTASGLRGSNRPSLDGNSGISSGNRLEQEPLSKKVSRLTDLPKTPPRHRSTSTSKEQRGRSTEGTRAASVGQHRGDENHPLPESLFPSNRTSQFRARSPSPPPPVHPSFYGRLMSKSNKPRTSRIIGDAAEKYVGDNNKKPVVDTSGESSETKPDGLESKGTSTTPAEGVALSLVGRNNAATQKVDATGEMREQNTRENPWKIRPVVSSYSEEDEHPLDEISLRKGMHKLDERAAACVIQAVCRGVVTRQRLLAQMGIAKRRKWESRTKSRTTTKIHSDIRRMARALLRMRVIALARDKYHGTGSMVLAIRRVCVIRIQKWWRTMMSRRRRPHSPFISLQARFRQVRQQRAYLEMKRSAIRIQSFCRCLLFRRRFRRIGPAAVLIQSIARRFVYRKLYKIERKLKLSYGNIEWSKRKGGYKTRLMLGSCARSKGQVSFGCGSASSSGSSMSPDSTFIPTIKNGARTLLLKEEDSILKDASTTTIVYKGGSGFDKAKSVTYTTVDKLRLEEDAERRLFTSANKCVGKSKELRGAEQFASELVFEKDAFVKSAWDAFESGDDVFAEEFEDEEEDNDASTSLLHKRGGRLIKLRNRIPSPTFRNRGGMVNRQRSSAPEKWETAHEKEARGRPTAVPHVTPPQPPHMEDFDDLILSYMEIKEDLDESNSCVASVTDEPVATGHSEKESHIQQGSIENNAMSQRNEDGMKQHIVISDPSAGRVLQSQTLMIESGVTEQSLAVVEISSRQDAITEKDANSTVSGGREDASVQSFPADERSVVLDDNKVNGIISHENETEHHEIESENDQDENISDNVNNISMESTKSRGHHKEPSFIIQEKQDYVMEEFF